MEHLSKMSRQIKSHHLEYLGFEKISQPACETGLDYDFHYYKKELLPGFTLISSEGSEGLDNNFEVQLVDVNNGESFIKNTGLLISIVSLFETLKEKKS